jgi:hypothetical protein
MTKGKDMTRLYKKRWAAGTALGVALTLVLSGTVTANAAEGFQTDAPGWYVIAPDGSSEMVEPGSARLSESTPGSSGRLLDPWMWSQCWAFNDSNFVITSYKWGWYGTSTKIDLKCGFQNEATGSGSGYKHIAANHQKDWQNKLDQIGDYRYSWDDVMSAGVHAALTYPDYTTSQAGQKRCAYGILAYVSSKGIQQMFEPTIVWSENNKLIITAIPKTKGSC